MGPLLLTTLSTLWPLLALAAALAVLGAVLRHPRVKGWRGERRVRRMIREGLNPHLYVDLHNVTLPTADGGSTQIDHLIFSPYGVFVLETKNLKGWIFGSERQAEWTQKIHANHSQKFQNPLRQNYLHTQTLRALLDLPAEQVHSVVAFVGESQFKTDMPPQVLQGRAFIGYILQFQQQIWGPEEMQGLIDAIEQHRLAPGRATERAHAAQVQQRRERKARAAPASADTSDGSLSGAQPGIRPQARRAAPTPQQVAAAPVLQEVVEAVAQPAMADAVPRATAEPLPISQTAPDAAPVHAAPPPAASVAPAVQATEPVAPTAAGVHIALGSAEKMSSAEAARPAAAPVHAHAAPQAQLVQPAPPTPSAPAPRPSRTCPQCQSALGRMRLQRGPLAGQVIYRCSNTALCQYVQPLPDSMPVPVSA